ncbi:hypothetical protein ACFY1U_39710 [Streptomyces sp. NPDC001351]|uniref:hypothetical protein n=1 Tax=Streptomyces sp. NPDC001351 TaxID=3364564 RepID=UPI0036ADDCE2
MSATAPWPTLSHVDWSDCAGVETALRSALLVLREPGTLNELVTAAAKDDRLLSLSEVRSWGNRLTVYDDPRTGVRLRLQHWLGGDTDPHGRPHNHRWCFASTILRGSYEHHLYGTVDEVTDRLATGPVRPLHVRTEAKGSLYVLRADQVHAATARPGTLSLLLRGPAASDHAVRLNADHSALSERKRGAAIESRAELPNVSFTTEHAVELASELASSR